MPEASLRVYATIFHTLSSERQLTYGRKPSGVFRKPAELNLSHANVRLMLAKPAAVITPEIIDKVRGLKHCFHLQICIAAHGHAGNSFLYDECGNKLHYTELAQQIAALCLKVPLGYKVDKLTVKLDCCYSAAGESNSFAAMLLIALQDIHYVPEHIVVRGIVASLQIQELVTINPLFFMKAFARPKEESVRLFTCKKITGGGYVVHDLRQADSKDYIIKQFNKISQIMPKLDSIDPQYSPHVHKMLRLLTTSMLTNRYGVDNLLWYLQVQKNIIIGEVFNLKLKYNNADLHILIGSLLGRLEKSNYKVPDKREYIYLPRLVNQPVLYMHMLRK